MRHSVTLALSGIAASALVLLSACATTGAVPVTESKTTTYTAGGEVADRTTTVNDRVTSELHRIFELTSVTGVGIFEHTNEGLARTSALSLAQADLAQKVQTMVRANTVVMNNADVRSMVETNVNAIVKGYTVDTEGYDPGTKVYRVRISILGERLVKEIERLRVR